MIPNLVVMPIFGTRPEAIKMFPVIHALKKMESASVRVCVTGQHREMLDQVLEIADIQPDIDLAVMQANQSLDSLLSRLVTQLGDVLDRERPDRILVHGDTLTTMAASISAYFRKIPVGHVEAGLRSGNIYSPWPEEVNRRVTGVIADLHFAPTPRAASALIAENVCADNVFVTGNTVVDALLTVTQRISENEKIASGLDNIAQRFAGKRIIAVTSHRRENFGEGMQSIASAIARIAARDDIAIVFPLHPNPNVRPHMEARLGKLANVALIDPLDYIHFVRLLGMSHIVLTDSGGVQEEAPSLGKPVLVMRDTTERPEGIEAGTATLVGTDDIKIADNVFSLLDNPETYGAMSKAHNPFGDGLAAERITQIIAKRHGH